MLGMKREESIVALVFLVVVAASVALSYTTQPRACESYQCFQQQMASCSQATYVNEEPEASWNYEIKNKMNGGCEIDVMLLQAKEGDLQLRNFEGHRMTCTYPLGVAAYPDKDMSLCHGLLKEDLQGLIIEKMHAYVDSRLSDIKDGLDNITISG